jgi:hypothetical protein
MTAMLPHTDGPSQRERKGSHITVPVWLTSRYAAG